jgi:hypothetical protein
MMSIIGELIVKLVMNFGPSATLVLICLGLWGSVSGQDPKTEASIKSWSPPDRSFSLEVPFGGSGIKDERRNEQGYKSVQIYSARQGGEGFLIVVLELQDEDKFLTSIDKFEGLQFFIGGDDDQQFSERFIKVDGMTAKEIVFVKRAHKGLFIDAGNRIYVLGFFAKQKKELEKGAAKRFFRSFHLSNPKP